MIIWSLFSAITPNQGVFMIAYIFLYHKHLYFIWTIFARFFKWSSQASQSLLYGNMTLKSLFMTLPESIKFVIAKLKRTYCIQSPGWYLYRECCIDMNGFRINRE